MDLHAAVQQDLEERLLRGPWFGDERALGRAGLRRQPVHVEEVPDDGGVAGEGGDVEGGLEVAVGDGGACGCPGLDEGVQVREAAVAGEMEEVVVGEGGEARGEGWCCCLGHALGWRFC